MRTRGEIAQKYKQRRYRHLAKILRKKLGRHCDNCQFNAVHVDQNSNTVRYCWYGQESKEPFTAVVCDDRLDEGRQVQRCLTFTPLKREALVKTFDLSLADPQRLISEYPDLAALQWVLEDPVHLKWWDRVREFFLVRWLYVFFRSVSSSAHAKNTPNDSDSY